MQAGRRRSRAMYYSITVPGSSQTQQEGEAIIPRGASCDVLQQSPSLIHSSFYSELLLNSSRKFLDAIQARLKLS